MEKENRVTEQIEDLGGGLFQPICHTPEQPEHKGDITDLQTTCKVCGKTIFPNPDETEYCEEHGGQG